MGTMMRAVMIIACLALATANDPNTILEETDAVVPDETLYLDDDLAEAHQKIKEMTSAGANDKDCRKLVTETRKTVQTDVDTCQKTLNAMPNGDHCMNVGQAVVKSATEAKSKADKHVTYYHTKVTKAASASVAFGSRTFSSLTEGKCSSFFTSTSYTTAEATYKSTVTAYPKATGAASEAAIALKNAVAAAARRRLSASAPSRRTTSPSSLLSPRLTLRTRRHGTSHARLSVCSMARPPASAELPPSV